MHWNASFGWQATFARMHRNVSFGLTDPRDAGEFPAHSFVLQRHKLFVDGSG
jgi:hypothetical protein